MFNPIGIKHFMKIPPSSWNAFADRSDSAWLYHRWEWQKLMSDTWDGYNLSFAIGEEGKMTGIFPAFQMKACPQLIDSGFGHGGFAYSGDHDKKIMLRTILSSIRGIYWNTFNERIDGRFFRIVLPPFGGQFEIDYDEYIKMGFNDCSTVSMLIDLTNDEDKIFSGFSSTTRNNIRNAIKAGVTCRSLDLGEESAKTYYSLHEGTYGRNEINPHPYEYFLSLHTIMKDFYICMAAYDAEGGILNMANFGIYKRMAFYSTAASTDESQKTNAAKVLQWEAMREMKRRGVEAYGIGEVFPDAKPEDGKLYGLSRFKSSFGGERIPSRKVICSITKFLE